jgi:hypothetical protein
MTATETFLKNIVLDIFILILIFTRKHSKPGLSLVQQYLWTTLIILGFFGFSMHSVKHLPPIDFRYWKEGKDLTLASSSPATVYLVYQNIETGEEQSFLSEELPWEDSVWMSEWEFKEQIIDQDEAQESHDLQILDEYGEDITDFILLNSEYQFIVCVPSIHDGNEEGLVKIMEIADELREYPYSWILLSGSFEEEISDAYKKLGHSLPYGQADDIVLKTMVRANPGVLLLKDGIILKKWHHNDFPDAQLLLETYSDFIN